MALIGLNNNVYIDSLILITHELVLRIWFLSEYFYFEHLGKFIVVSSIPMFALRMICKGVSLELGLFSVDSP